MVSNGYIIKTFDMSRANTCVHDSREEVMTTCNAYRTVNSQSSAKTARGPEQRTYSRRLTTHLINTRIAGFLWRRMGARLESEGIILPQLIDIVP